MINRPRKFNESRATEVLTSVNVPIEVLKDIKYNGLSLKACLLKGYKVLKGDDSREKELFELKKELQEYEHNISRLSAKVSQLTAILYNNGLDPFKINK